MANIPTFSAPKLMREHCTLHVRVTGIGLMKLRLRLAIPIVWFAAKIAGTGFSVDFDKE